MQLHQLKLNYKRKKIKRIGRGGKRGTYSGKGQKGQKSRAGHRIRPAERDILAKIPKLRGVKNKPLGPRPVIFNVGDLERVFKNASIVDKKVLKELGFIRNKKDEAKILGNGDLKKAFTIEGVKVSKQAKLKIEQAGGKVIL